MFYAGAFLNAPCGLELRASDGVYESDVFEWSVGDDSEGTAKSSVQGEREDSKTQREARPQDVFFFAFIISIKKKMCYLCCTDLDPQIMVVKFVLCCLRRRFLF